MGVELHLSKMPLLHSGVFQEMSWRVVHTYHARCHRHACADVDALLGCKNLGNFFNGSWRWHSFRSFSVVELSWCASQCFNGTLFSFIDFFMSLILLVMPLTFLLYCQTEWVLYCIFLSIKKTFLFPDSFFDFNTLNFVTVCTHHPCIFLINWL